MILSFEVKNAYLSFLDLVDRKKRLPMTITLIASESMNEHELRLNMTTHIAHRIIELLDEEK